MPSPRVEAIRRVFSSLASSKTRQQLLDANQEDIISILRERGGPKHAYVIGSMASNKQRPKDVDILGIYNRSPLQTDPEHPLSVLTPQKLGDHMDGLLAPELDYWAYTRGAPTVESVTGGVNQAFDEGAEYSIKEMFNKARERYGSDYKWVRLFSLLSALGLAKEEEDEVR